MYEQKGETKVPVYDTEPIGWRITRVCQSPPCTKLFEIYIGKGQRGRNDQKIYCSERCCQRTMRRRHRLYKKLKLDTLR